MFAPSISRTSVKISLLAVLLLLLLAVGRQPTAQANEATPPARPTEPEMPFTGTVGEALVVGQYVTYLPLAQSGVTPIIPETTEVVTEETAEMLMDLSDDGTLTFDGTTEQLQGLQLGDVLVGGANDAAPDGYLRRVENVSLSGGNVVVQTEQATLEDAIEQGSGGISRQLQASDVQAVIMLPGVEMVSPSGPEDLDFGFTVDHVLYSVGPAEVKAVGELEVSLGIDFSVALKGFKVKQVTAALNVEEDASLKLVASADLLGFSKCVPIAVMKFNPISFTVGPVPVWITPQLPIEVCADGSLSVGLEAGMAQHGNFRVGARYAHRQWDDISYSNVTFEPILPTPTIGIEVKAYVEPRLELLLYGIGGPTFAIDPFVKFEAELISQEWTLSAGLEAKLGVTVQVLGETVVSYDATLITISFDLLSGGFNEPPYEPSNPDPPYGATNQPVELELIWTGGDPEDDPVTYEVFLEKNDVTPDVLVCAGMPDEYCYVAGLDYDSLYWWQVVATDSEGNVTFGDYWKFTTAEEGANQPPYPPSDPEPANGAINQPTMLYLEWYGSDPDGDSLTYDVLLNDGGNTPLMVVSTNQIDNYYEVSGLDQDTLYKWQIRAYDPGGLYTDGPVWTFTTADAANNPPYEPSSPVPADYATEQPLNVQLEWIGGDPDGDAVTYDVYFAGNDPTPDFLLCDDTSSESCNATGLSYGVTYYWKVVAQDAYGATTAGPIWRFETQSGGGADVILDGGFEAGSPNPYWDEASTNFGTPICDIPTCTGQGAHSGDYWAWFGGVTGVEETGSVDQDVVIPVGTATLSFYLRIPVANTTGFLHAMIDGNIVASYTEADQSAYANWQLELFDVSAYADGGLHNVAFVGTTYAGAGNLSFYLDDVVLNAGALSAAALSGDLELLAPSTIHRDETPPVDRRRDP